MSETEEVSATCSRTVSHSDSTINTAEKAAKDDDTDDTKDLTLSEVNIATTHQGNQFPAEQTELRSC